MILILKFFLLGILTSFLFPPFFLTTIGFVIFPYFIYLINKHETKQYGIPLLRIFTEFMLAYIRDYININGFGEVYIMEKSKPYPCNKGDYKSKDGIHILFPNIILDRNVYKLMMKQINSDEINNGMI